MNWYNEIDRKKAAWLRELIHRDVIAPGVVDERSVDDISAAELTGYTQCHFFAGIGVWSYALRLAGWPDDEPVWTGSCPCSPFSTAGKRKGKADKRHLWPSWFRLIAESRPRHLFAEQVASRDGLAWLDNVYTDLEGAGYAVGAVDLCSASFGAPHIRQRLYIVGQLGHTNSERCIRQPVCVPIWRPQQPSTEIAGAGAVNGFWRDAEWIWCRDEKYRPAKPGIFPLVARSAVRFLRLRSYGDGLTAPVAAEFIKACMFIFGERWVA